MSETEGSPTVVTNQQNKPEALAQFNTYSWLLGDKSDGTAVKSK